MARILAYTPTYGDGPRAETLEAVSAQTWGGELTHEVGWLNPFPRVDNRNVVAQYERARAMALEGDYGALWTVEHDMYPPKDALALLWETGEPVVYGVYMLRHGAFVLNAWEYLPNSINLGESLSLKRDRSILRGVVPVSGIGFGCTLIRRPVLEALRFHGGETTRQAPDLPFARECVRDGIRQVAHFDVLCGHYDPAKGDWVWPWEGVRELGKSLCQRG